MIVVALFIVGAVVTVDVDSSIDDRGEEGAWVDERLRTVARIDAIQAAVPPPRPTLRLGLLHAVLFGDLPLANEQWGPVARDPAAKTRRVHLRADVDVGALHAAACKAARDSWVPSIDIIVEGHDAEDVAAVDSAFAAAFAAHCIDRLPTQPLLPLRAYLKASDADDVLVVNVDGDRLRAVLGSSASRDINLMVQRPRADLAAVDEIVEQCLSRITMCWCNDCCVYNRVVSVEVRGVTSKRRLKLLHAALGGMEDTDSIALRKHADGSALFSIEFDGGAERFAEFVENDVVGDRTVEVIEVTRGKVILQLNPKPRAPPVRP